MSNIAVVKFNSGEVTPEADARKDIPKYTGGCRTLQNMIPDIYGNATKRPGTELITVGNGAGCYFEPPAIDETKIGISTEAELALIGNDGGYPMDGDYELRAELDFTGIVFWPIGRPVANRDIVNSFSGTFDGRYYTIDNITYDEANHFDNTSVESNFGLFAKTTTNAQLDNIFITNMNITGPTDVNFCGLLSGDGSAFVVTNCHTQGTITITSGVGGGEIGGMFGASGNDTSCIKCSANVVITSSSGSASSEIGGFVGRANGTYLDCYAEGSITMLGTPTFGLNLVGGFAGKSLGAISITNCYSAVVITGKEYFAVGGFLGFQDDDPAYAFSDCFWDITIEPDHSDLGHLGEVTDTPVSVPTDVADITAGTSSGDGSTVDMYREATFTNWDFDDVWQIREGRDYPRHRWNNIASDCIWI